jgi:hypothetical protein
LQLRQTAIRGRHRSTHANWIEEEEARIQRLEEAILFLAAHSQDKEKYVTVFLQNLEHRQVDREVGLLEAKCDVLAFRRTACWDEMGILMDD